MSNPQLFCFTYAGGKASFFDDLEKDLPEFEVVKFEYAGHGTRHKEPFYSNFDELADDAYDFIRTKLTDAPYALFGYSMGSITLMEVLKRILSDDRAVKRPTRLFLGAHEPEPRKMIRELSEEQLDDWVKTRTIQFGAVPEKLLNNKPFWRTYLPLYRADYRIIGDHRFEELEIRSEIPTTVFYSETDTPLETMKPWRDYLFRCSFQCFEGSHFFMREHHKEIAERIMRDIKKQ